MHVSSKEVVADQKQARLLGVPVGAHILTNTLEGDGAVELASKDAELHAEVIAVSRTASGGIKVVTAVAAKEPKPVAPQKPEDANLAFLKSKGLSDDEAAGALERFGSDRISAQRAKAAAEKQKALDSELEALLTPAPPADAK